MTHHPGIGFTRWLRRQVHRQDAIGELGRFAAEDPCWVASKYRSVPIYHLREQHPGREGMIQTIFAAWQEFREFRKGVGGWLVRVVPSVAGTATTVSTVGSGLSGLTTQPTNNHRLPSPPASGLRRTIAD